jgi:homoserine dehydrogenase
MIGVGNVGSAVLRQLDQQRASLSRVRRHGRRSGEQQAIRRRPRRHRSLGVEGRAADGAGPHGRREVRGAAGRARPYERRPRRLHGRPTIVDAYPAFIEANLHIITPNKWANALPWRRYSTLMEGSIAGSAISVPGQRRRGLPVMSTLRDLIASGDEIVGSASVGDAELPVQHLQPCRSLAGPARIAWATRSRIRARICRVRTWQGNC